jgi:hypothetical protein
MSSMTQRIAGQQQERKDVKVDKCRRNSTMSDAESAEATGYRDSVEAA